MCTLITLRGRCEICVCVCVCVCRGFCVSGEEEKEEGGARLCVHAEDGGVYSSPSVKLLTFVLFSLHYVTGAVLRWISYKSPMQHIQHATSSLTSLIMDEEIVIQE